MANLTRTFRWERFTPDIGDNLELSEGQRLELEVASGLTGAQLAAHSAALTAAFEGAREAPETLPGRLAEAFAPYVRVVGTHTVDGQPVASLADYLTVVAGLSGVFNLSELAAAVRRYNSVEGTAELFSARRSGGSRTTRGQSAAAPAGVH